MSKIDDARNEVDQSLVNLETAMSHLRMKKFDGIDQVQQVKRSINQLREEATPYLIGVGVLAGAYMLMRFFRERRYPTRRVILELHVPVNNRRSPKISLVK